MTLLNFPTSHDLTPVQETVLAAITGGATLQAAAEAATIHRNTISYWRRTSAAFRDALTHAHYDKALFVREQAETRVTAAFAAIDNLLADPAVSPAARLNAAKYIIEKASTPPPPKPEVIYEIQRTPPEIAHSPAQSEPPTPAPEPQNSEPVHKNAQSAPLQPIRSAPKVGRNELCPCGSHLKFKRCCLGKDSSTSAAHANAAC